MYLCSTVMSCSITLHLCFAYKVEGMLQQYALDFVWPVPYTLCFVHAISTICPILYFTFIVCVTECVLWTLPSDMVLPA